MWTFLSALGTPQQWRPTFVRLIGSLAFFAGGHASHENPRLLTDGPVDAPAYAHGANEVSSGWCTKTRLHGLVSCVRPETEVERLACLMVSVLSSTCTLQDGGGSDCASREASFEGRGFPLLLPGPNPNPHHDLQPAAYLSGNHHFHRSSAPVLSFRTVSTVHATHPHGLRAFSSCSPLAAAMSGDSYMSFSSLSESLDGAHGDGEGTETSTPAHAEGPYPPGWRVKPMLALCWYDHKTVASSGTKAPKAADQNPKDVQDEAKHATQHAAAAAPPPVALAPAAPIAGAAAASGHAAPPQPPPHAPHHGGIPHAPGSVHGHGHAAHTIPPPQPPACGHPTSGHFVPQRVEMGLATDMGARNCMEDFAFAVPLKAHGGHMDHHLRHHSSEHSGHPHGSHVRFTHAVCFGVFDGHGGAEIAESLAAHVPSGIQTRAEHIAVHGPQHVGEILAAQERRLRARRHVHHHHHHHGHQTQHRARSQHAHHAGQHSHSQHRATSTDATATTHHNKHMDGAHGAHRLAHSPSASRSPDRRPHGPTTAVQAVAMATAAAAQLQAAHGSARCSSGGSVHGGAGAHGLASSPQRYASPLSRDFPSATVTAGAGAQAQPHGVPAQTGAPFEPAGSTSSALSMGSKLSASTFGGTASGGRVAGAGPWSGHPPAVAGQLSSSPSGPFSSIPGPFSSSAGPSRSSSRPVPTPLPSLEPGQWQEEDVVGVVHDTRELELASSLRSDLGDLCGSCLSDAPDASLSDAATSSTFCTAGLDGRDPGSTALVAVVIDGAMHVANVGDCRLVLGELVEGGRVTARRVTCDHAPAQHPGEAERLKRLQVPISDDGYVGDYTDLPMGGGMLQVSRSIGDFRCVFVCVPLFVPATFGVSYVLATLWIGAPACLPQLGYWGV